MNEPKRIILITGGSRGIGAATARLAARGGYDVAISYRRDADAAKAILRCLRDDGARAVAVQADTADEAQIEALFRRVDSELGPVAALVNNAGILGRPMLLEDSRGADLSAMLDINVRGCFLCLREAIKRMRARGGGAVVNVSSRLAELGGAGGFTAYAASKGAIESLTRGAARELAGSGIRVNAVSPGVIDTEIHAAAGMPDRARDLAAQIPLGRAGGAEEVAQAVLWLLSDAAAYVTGAVMPVSGGR